MFSFDYGFRVRKSYSQIKLVYRFDRCRHPAKVFRREWISTQLVSIVAIYYRTFAIYLQAMWLFGAESSSIRRCLAEADTAQFDGTLRSALWTHT
jgi:hypothetical protein